jgi:hypothetical protein
MKTPTSSVPVFVSTSQQSRINPAIDDFLSPAFGPINGPRRLASQPVELFIG